jgi:UDP-2,3-diacylglucosamine pyrophosphatase LpxH
LKDGIIVPKAAASSDKHPWLGELPDIGGGRFSFAVMGDRTGLQIPGIFESAVSAAAGLHPDFIISVGDLVEGYCTAAEKAGACRDWEATLALLNGLGVPFFTAVGNHDYGNPLQVEIWKKYFGHEYYAFRIGKVLFLVLNTVERLAAPFEEGAVRLMRSAARSVRQHPRREREIAAHVTRVLNAGNSNLDTAESLSLRLSQRQMDFAEATVRANRDAARVCIVTHLPFWKGKKTKQYEDLMRLCAGIPLTVIAGHLHTLEYTEKGDRAFIQIGRTGGICWGPAGRGGFHHFLWVNVENGEMEFTVFPVQKEMDLSDYQTAALDSEKRKLL